MGLDQADELHTVPIPGIDDSYSKLHVNLSIAGIKTVNAHKTGNPRKFRYIEDGKKRWFTNIGPAPCWPLRVALTTI